MKVMLHDEDASFWIELEAESMEDAARIVRFGVGATKEILHTSASANKNGRFTCTIGIGRYKGSGASIPKSRGRK